ncbi:MAG TPA: hypothetical protein VFG86_08410, partial [Chloroflexota bacterium]|nr:hypothetical protein [Chloroflexota bacterium]
MEAAFGSKLHYLTSPNVRGCHRPEIPRGKVEGLGTVRFGAHPVAGRRDMVGLDEQLLDQGLGDIGQFQEPRPAGIVALSLSKQSASPAEVRVEGCYPVSWTGCEHRSLERLHRLRLNGRERD